MASSIVIARAFRYSSEIPDAEMITTPLETSSTSPIIIDLDNEDSPTELEEYAEDVKKYGSHQYTSHRKASKSVARRFDELSTN